MRIRSSVAAAFTYGTESSYMSMIFAAKKDKRASGR